jgi:hypothetical protein
MALFGFSASRDHLPAKWVRFGIFHCEKAGAGTTHLIAAMLSIPYFPAIVPMFQSFLRFFVSKKCFQ